MSNWGRTSERAMSTKLFRILPGFYKPLFVLLVIGAAALLLWALKAGVNGRRGDSICFEAAFDDLSRSKDRSNVLFKGMTVGTVGVMEYDPAIDKIVVRIDIQDARGVPANIKPYVESSGM